MPSQGGIRIGVQGEVATLELCNPTRRNAISMAMWEGIIKFSNDMASRPSVRVIAIRGEGTTAFSAGADISGFASGRSSSAQSKEYDDRVEEACRSIESLPQVTVALLRGACVGAGASLAASCDILAASEDVFFAVPAAKLGLGYDPRGIERFLRVFGLQVTRSLVYSAERLAVQRVYASGAIHLLASAKAFDESTQGLMRRIAANAPLTLAAAKTAIRALTVRRDAKLLDQAYALATKADASLDYEEGRTAFSEKRPPRFEGK